MKVFLATVFVFVSVVAAQSVPERAEAGDTGSIRGVVRDIDSRRPAPRMGVRIRLGTRQVGGRITVAPNTPIIKTVSDAEGRYVLDGVPAGTHFVTVVGKGFGNQTQRLVTLSPGQELSGIDLVSKTLGTIKGTVHGEDGEPVVGAAVFLVSQEYSGTTPRYYMKRAAFTDDRGAYAIEDVPPGLPWRVMAQKRVATLPAISPAPKDLARRKRSAIATYYPESPEAGAGVAFFLYSGEARGSVDIRLRSAPSFCVEAVAFANGLPGSMKFTIEGEAASSGNTDSGGFFVAPPEGMAGADGAIRICDLAPGRYRLSVFQKSGSPGMPPLYASETVVIVDRDIAGVRLDAAPAGPLQVEVSRAGAKTAGEAVDGTVRVYLEPAQREGITGESLSARSPIPGEFQLPWVLPGEYRVVVFLPPGGLYVKDILYGTDSVLRDVLRLGTASGGDALRVVIGDDPGTVNATVTGKDGQPVADCRVYLLPAPAQQESDLINSVVSGATDQYGAYRSGASLRPGKYYVLATPFESERTPDALTRLFAARANATEIELAGDATLQLKLQVQSLE